MKHGSFEGGGGGVGGENGEPTRRFIQSAGPEEEILPR